MTMSIDHVAYNVISHEDELLSKGHASITVTGPAHDPVEAKKQTYATRIREYIANSSLESIFSPLVLRLLNLSVVEDIFLVAPIVLFVSLVIGVSFYYFIEDWDLPTSIYYATQALLGEMFLAPGEGSSVSQVFTLCYYLYGTTLLAGAIGTFSTSVVAASVKYERQRARFMTNGESEEEEESYGNLYKQIIHYFSQPCVQTTATTIVALLTWILVGVLYGHHIEGWDYGAALYYVLAAISGTGVVLPGVCAEEYGPNCRLHTRRALSISIYLLIGIPLYGYTMGQYAGFIVSRAIRTSEFKFLTRPLTEDEYQLAMDICRHSKPHHQVLGVSHLRSLSGSFSGSAQTPRQSNPQINLTEFIILELLRLKRFDEDDILEITQLFNAIDSSGEGVIETKRLRHASVLNDDLYTTFRDRVDGKKVVHFAKHSELASFNEQEVQDYGSTSKASSVNGNENRSRATSFGKSVSEKSIDDEEDFFDTQDVPDHDNYNDLVLAARFSEMSIRKNHHNHQMNNLRKITIIEEEEHEHEHEENQHL
jgi:hypothetical protein